MHTVAAAQQLEVLGGRIEGSASPNIIVDQDVLAVDTWPTLIEDSQMDLRERGLVIGRLSKMLGGRLIRSRIYESYLEESGYEDDDIEEPNEDESQEAEPISVFIPKITPLGLKTLIMAEELVAIHTHPMGENLDHIPTMPFSDKDIHSFVNNTLRHAMVSIDRGGAHLMVRNSGYPREAERELNKSKLVHAVYTHTRDNRRPKQEGPGETMQSMVLLARQLFQYGIGYFYTPDIQPRNGGVEFQNLRQMEIAGLVAMPPYAELKAGLVDENEEGLDEYEDGWALSA